VKRTKKATRSAEPTAAQMAREEEEDRLRADALNRAALKALVAGQRELLAAVEALIRGSET
jgi:hypothetical protein